MIRLSSDGGLNEVETARMKKVHPGGTAKIVTA